MGEKCFDFPSPKTCGSYKKYKIDFSEIDNITPQEFLSAKSEYEIAAKFDALKESYGRDIFGQGYIYRLIDDNEMADVETLTDDEKENGISIDKNYYVPYDKGDKDGNCWYLETPFAIAWSQDNVHFLKNDKNARYQGYSFYFKEGFAWSAINGRRSSNELKFRFKGKSVNDVQGMSLSSVCNSITEKFIVCVSNSDFTNRYTESFINSTVIFQINDARQMMIKIPNAKQLSELETLFDRAYKITKEKLASLISEINADVELTKI